MKWVCEAERIGLLLALVTTQQVVQHFFGLDSPGHPVGVGHYHRASHPGFLQQNAPVV